MQEPHYVQALEAERAMRIAAGNTERAAEVTAELERVTGHKIDTAAEPTANARPRPAKKASKT